MERNLPEWLLASPYARNHRRAYGVLICYVIRRRQMASSVITRRAPNQWRGHRRLCGGELLLTGVIIYRDVDGKAVIKRSARAIASYGR